IPDVIFGGDDSLDFTELSQRVEAVVVYSHFAALLPRYMQKKELGTLSRDQCAKLIARADRRLRQTILLLIGRRPLIRSLNCWMRALIPACCASFLKIKNEAILRKPLSKRMKNLAGLNLSRRSLHPICSTPRRLYLKSWLEKRRSRLKMFLIALQNS